VSGVEAGKKEVEPLYFVAFAGELGLLEHIADRANYREVVKLARKIAPGVKFPLAPN